MGERLSRRQMLALAGGGGVVGVAGVLILSEPPGNPGERVKEYYNAVKSGSASEANALLHPDGRIGPMSDAVAEQYSEANLTVHEIDVQTHTRKRAVVAADVELRLMGEREREVREVELRRHADEWRIWDSI